MKRILALLFVLAVWSTPVFGQDELEKIKELANTDSVHVPALLQAILQGETETVKTLIKEGEDVNEYWYYREDDPYLYIGYTPLELATTLGNLDIMGLLLDNGSNLYRLVDGYLHVPALTYADDVEAAQLLLDRGAFADGDVGEGGTVLSYAAEGGNIDVVKLLIDHGADVNAPGELGITPLHRAKNAEIAQLLIDHGANVHGDCCDTPLLSAVWNDKNDIVKILIDHGADVNAKDIDGHTPLDIAIERGQDEIAALLREHGGVATK